MEDREYQPTIEINSFQRDQGDLTPSFSSLIFPLVKCLAPHLFLNRFNPLLKNATKNRWLSLRNWMIPRHPFSLNVKFCFKEYQCIIRLNFKSRNGRGRIYLTRERYSRSLDKRSAGWLILKTWENGWISHEHEEISAPCSRAVTSITWNLRK